jgi:hypothetical protein
MVSRALLRFDDRWVRGEVRDGDDLKRHNRGLVRQFVSAGANGASGQIKGLPRIGLLQRGSLKGGFLPRKIAVADDASAKLAPLLCNAGGRSWPIGLATVGRLDGRLLGSTRRRGVAADRRWLRQPDAG